MAHSEGLHFKTVVLDAGHGGKDFGASSADKRTHEKNINLDVALRLKKLINEAAPDVKVVMTRSTDVFVPLADRAEIANKANANLFISIHVNSYFRTAPHGSSVHVLGQSSRQDRDLFAFNQEICRRENSVIYLENDYTTRYEGFDPSDEESLIFMTLMQSAYLEQSIRFAEIVDKNMKATGPFSFSRGLSQDPFFVLWKTAMPAVLVELGFLSNAADLAVLRDGSNLEKIAKSLLSAFLEY
ncbi:MAG: N-acetylmuramoyl-L-alanine amidase, partial [Bacteroidales bacterium]|nr:N-acetylmuramoyl-L-alanine amidase [Bacteroidales bacterium]